MADIGREIGWDDEITNDGEEFVLLPAGDYEFEVVAFERGRHDGSPKLPPCNKAVLSLRITGPEGSTTIQHNLFLHTKTEGMISQFLICIGQKKHGERVTMDWTKVIGSKGRAHFKPRTYTDRDGNERQANDVDRFYDWEEQYFPAERVRMAELAGDDDELPFN